MLKEKLNRWLKIDPIRIIKRIISDRSIIEFIEKANREQLLDGENSLGVKLSDIGGGYSNLTLSLHPEKVRDRVNLFDTGEFHKSITVKLNNDLFDIEADPIKEDTNLYDEWGVDIIGLNEKNFEILIDTLEDRLINEILRQVQLN